MPTITSQTRQITTPGIYDLTDDVYYAGGYGLSILCDDVTIRLNNHTIGGYGTTGINAINRDDIVITGGRIEGDWLYNVRIEGADTTGNIVSNCIVAGGDLVGIAMQGIGSLAYGNSVFNIGDGDTERCFAFKMDGQDATVSHNYIWDITGAVESGGIATTGSDHFIWDNSFNSYLHGGDWYGAWVNGSAEFYDNDFYDGEFGIAAPGSVYSHSNSFYNVVTPYSGNVVYSNDYYY